VTYSSDARVEIPLVHMTEPGKKKVDEILDRMCVEGSTNIWAGLEKGLDLFTQRVQHSSRNCSLLLLTDGMADHSAEFMLSSFRSYKDAKPVPCEVSTFGFGYSINSQLLVAVAKEGNGMYSFIPDSSFVGTTFVNATSNILATMGTEVTVSFEHGRVKQGSYSQQ